MGFKLEPTVVVLEFAEGHALHGATVRVSLDMTLDEHEEMLAKSRTGDASALVARFAAALESWDIEWQGEEVPATREGLGRLPSWVADELTSAWLRARGGLPLANAKRSTPGDTPA